jgi:hypothetical protein
MLIYEDIGPGGSGIVLKSEFEVNGGILIANLVIIWELIRKELR